MLTTRLLHFAESLMRTPAAPFREDWMCATLDALLEEIPGLEVEVDAWGNRHATVRPPGPAGERAPLVLVAHLDHPGFLVTGVSPDNGGHRLRAVFEGRVFDEFFPGGRVRVFSSPLDAGVPGRVVSFSPRGGAEDNRQIEIETEAPAPGARIAMWDLPAFEADAAHIRGRACDDLCGAAAILAALDHLARHTHTMALPVTGLFTRAEEAGFCGALCLINSDERPRFLPPDALVVSVEISSARPTTPLGGGAVLRVGDKAMSFDAPFLDRLWRSTAQVRAEGKLAAVRALMDGGTCEATAFGAEGYRAAGVCAPVENYHNMDMASGRIAAERVSISDLRGLAEMMALFGQHLAPAEEHRAQLRADMAPYVAKGRRRLTLEGLPAGNAAGPAGRR